MPLDGVVWVLVMFTQLDWRTSGYAASNWRQSCSGVASGSLWITRMDQHSTCFSNNLIYLLSFTRCNAFYMEEIRNSLSNRMKGHSSFTVLHNLLLPVAIYTKSYQLSFKRRQECDTYLTHVCRHHWSRKSPMTIDEIGAFSQHWWKPQYWLKAPISSIFIRLFLLLTRVR